MIFDDSIYKLDDSKYTIMSSGNNESEVVIKQSDHHIIIEPNNTNFDRYLIQEIVKEYAKKYSKNNHNSKNLNFHEKMKHMCLGQHQH
jgi:replication factor C subunit 3/5